MVSIRVIFGSVLSHFSFLYFGGVFNKTTIPLVLAGYEMIMRASLAIYHLTSNTPVEYLVKSFLAVRRNRPFARSGHMVRN